MKKRILILGAGPTGIGAALRLLEKGHDDFLIIEATDHPGGLAASYTDEHGFTWDVGGHVQFSHYNHFDQAMDLAMGTDGWLFHERQSFVWMENRFIPYPLQNNIRHLANGSRHQCIAGLEKATTEFDPNKKPAHFREWILATFGDGLARVFMLPYNGKVWAHPPETMDYTWIGERVSVVDVDRVKDNIRLKRDDVSWGPNNKFRFPRRGGTGQIWQNLAARIPAGNLSFMESSTQVSLARREVLTSAGRILPFDALISSIPLDCLCEQSGDERLKELGRKLVFASSNIVGVGLRGTCPGRLEGKCWMYFPESDCPFYRVTVFSHYSPENVPDPRRYWSLMTETSESPYKPVNHETLVEETIAGLLRTGLIHSPLEIASSWRFRARHGYPVPFLERDEVLAGIHARLEERDVFSRGRFGGWKYEVSNQDHSFMQGVEVVDRLLEGAPEVTFVDPARVNQGRKI